MRRELRFRRLIPMTHEEYGDEPARNVDWFPEIHRVEQEVAQRRG